jgi:hypothetical protein
VSKLTPWINSKASSVTSRKSVAIIDGSLDHYQNLVSAVTPGTDVFVLDPRLDGITQITQWLSNYRNLDSIQIFSHGDSGRLILGSTVLSSDTLSQYSRQLQQWGSSLSSQGDMLLFGCNIARDNTTLIDHLSQITGADIAASTNLTGAAAGTGDWVLEAKTGVIEAQPNLNSEALQNYDSVLNVITVTNAADRGVGSLRAAIAAAPPGARIRFAPGLANRIITLTSGQLVINKNLTIDGAGAANLTISGNNASRVLYVQNGRNLTLQNLIIANGRLNASAGETNLRAVAGAGILAEGGNTLTLVNTQVNNNVAGFGGGVYTGFRNNTVIINSSFNRNDGTAAFAERGGGAIATSSGGNLTIRGSRFTNNRGINGGAINSLLGGLTVENSVFFNNDSTPGGTKPGGTSGYGGAIYTDGANASGPNAASGPIGGTITIRNSRFERNRGAGQGGGLFLFAYPPDKVLVEGNTIIGNSVIRDAGGSALGGGLRHGNAELTIRNTTFANNSALGQGGGLWIGENSPTTITNSTFSGNSAADGSGGGLGGAIVLVNSNANATTIRNTTIVGNRAGFQGGAFWLGNQPVTLANSIVANNTAGNRWNTSVQTRRSLIDGGGNIEFPAPSPSDSRVTTNSQIANPLLGPLLDTGGGFLTHVRLPGSPAIALNAGASNPITPNNAIAFVGTSGPDTLLGNANSNVIVGNGGADVLTGGRGGDRFTYSGTNETSAFLNSRFGAVDRITDFRVTEGDRIQLNTDNNLITSERPQALFFTGSIAAGSLIAAARSAYGDKNRRAAGAQRLQPTEAVLFGWQQRTYLSVNDRSPGFTNQDLLIDVTGIVLPQNTAVGALPVATYFT